jgi:hypothetical protein
MTGGHSSIGGAAERRLDLAHPDAGLGQRRPHGDGAHVGPGHSLESPEGVEPDPADPHVTHEVNDLVTSFMR